MSSETDGIINNNHVKLTEAQLVYSEFGFPLEDCYKIAVKYYKEKERSGELTISYDDRVKLMALSKQVRLGPFSDGCEGAGWFDLVGSDMT
uniref:ACB domain-containing protein n=1 Tax=Heterorhabditis bacteriophora TaxID=37862 RepID=A0A1I7XL01_HETBA